MDEKTKSCSKCGKQKPLNQFGLTAGNRLQSVCMACMAEDDGQGGGGFQVDNVDQKYAILAQEEKLEGDREQQFDDIDQRLTDEQHDRLHKTEKDKPEYRSNMWGDIKREKYQAGIAAKAKVQRTLQTKNAGERTSNQQFNARQNQQQQDNRTHNKKVSRSNKAQQSLFSNSNKNNAQSSQTTSAQNTLNQHISQQAAADASAENINAKTMSSGNDTPLTKGFAEEMAKQHQHEKQAKSQETPREQADREAEQFILKTWGPGRGPGAR